MSITADNNFNLFCTEGTELNPLKEDAINGLVEKADVTSNLYV